MVDQIMVEDRKDDRKGLLEIGIKSEIAAQEAYGKLIERDLPKSFENKLVFLQREEEGHEETLRGIFEELYPDEEPDLPSESVVPMPEIEFDEGDSVSDILEAAMKSEIESEEFYRDLSREFDEDSKEFKLLDYLSRMERGHYEIIRNQLDSIKTFGNFKNFFKNIGSGRGL